MTKESFKLLFQCLFSFLNTMAVMESTWVVVWDWQDGHVCCTVGFVAVLRQSQCSPSLPSCTGHNNSDNTICHKTLRIQKWNKVQRPGHPTSDHTILQNWILFFFFFFFTSTKKRKFAPRTVCVWALTSWFPLSPVVFPASGHDFDWGCHTGRICQVQQR